MHIKLRFMHRIGDGKGVVAMCAIAGVIGVNTGLEVIQRMLMTMQRRGPDDNGVYREENIQLLHTRLAIIDPKGGRQPMELSHGGERYILVYNGELYNTQELRRELENAGHSFLGHSDTEVVLHAYAQWGSACVNRFNGIFAFAVWETNKHRLFLARDRIGVKPLFFFQNGTKLIFASEIKTILAHPSVKPKLGVEGAVQLVLMGPGRIPGSGIFHGIQELEPGCCAVLEPDGLHVVRYWRLMDREHSHTFEETAEYVRFLVTDAIQRQMVSDVPIGTFLSGGLDSSIISRICAEELRQKGETLKTFSVDYLNHDLFFTANKFQPEGDSDYIRLMQEYIQSDHHWSVLSPDSLADSLEEATIARDLPGMADVDFSLLAFCKEIRSYVKVGLSGECADEIFGGYPWYRDPEVRAREGFPWAQNTRQRSSLLSSELANHVDPESYIMDNYRTTCRETDILPGTSTEERRMKEMVNLNFRWFMQTLLDRKDRMSMYHSLEVRVPFCDYRIAEYLYGVPWQFKDHKGTEKGLLRYAMRGMLPDRVLYRKKSPYPKTFDPKYESMMWNRLQVLLTEDTPLFYVVEKNKIREILDGSDSWPWYGQLMRRPQIMAYLLQIDFWLRHYRVELLF